MLASDLQRLELIEVDRETGFPLFGASPLILFGMTALARIQKDLHHSLGPEKAAVIYARYGYELGIGAAIRIAELYRFDKAEEFLKAGCVLQTMMGLATLRIETLDLDPVRKRLRFSGTWTDGFEATLWRSQFPLSDHPVCQIVTGMLSGYASTVMGVDVWSGNGCQAKARLLRLCRPDAAGMGAHPGGVPADPGGRSIAEELSGCSGELGQTGKTWPAGMRRSSCSRHAYQPEPDQGIAARSPLMKRLLLAAEKVAAPAPRPDPGGERHGQGTARPLHHERGGAGKALPDLTVPPCPPR
jgi:hypothetical protein